MRRIEELEAAVKEAREVFDRAKLALADARADLQEAIDEESGLIGHVLEWTEERGWGHKRRTLTRRILVDRIERIGTTRALGYYLVASGAVGARRCYGIDISKATDLGPKA